MRRLISAGSAQMSKPTHWPLPTIKQWHFTPLLWLQGQILDACPMNLIVDGQLTTTQAKASLLAFISTAHLNESTSKLEGKAGGTSYETKWVNFLGFSGTHLSLTTYCRPHELDKLVHRWLNNSCHQRQKFEPASIKCPDSAAKNKTQEQVIHTMLSINYACLSILVTKHDGSSLA